MGAKSVLGLGCQMCVSKYVAVLYKSFCIFPSFRGGVAATFITTLMFMNEETVSKRGWSDTDQTRAMITSLWFISENVAGLLGTTFGG